MYTDVIPISFGNVRERVSADPTTIAAQTIGTAIRACRKEDLMRVAEIHKSQFLLKGSLVGQLSPALIATFYSAFLDRATFLVHASGGEINGFVLGGERAELGKCKTSFLRKHLLLCITDILQRPSLWPRAFRSLADLILHARRTTGSALPHKGFRMLSIAVDERAARKGVGTALVQGFEAEMSLACRAYGLNVLKTNTSAIDFYEKLGFQCVGETAIAWTLRRELPTVPARLVRRAA